MDPFGMEIKQTIRDKRISTGIEGLDSLLLGGFPQGSITLVSGTPGTGKTIVCFQYIDAGLKKGEKCLYLTSDERVNNLIYQAKEVGFNFQSFIDNGQLKFLYLDLERRDVHKEMDDEIITGGYTRVVLDSLTPLSEVPVWLVNKGNEEDDCTTLVTSEIPEGSRCLSRDSISEFLVDGILLLDLDSTMDRRKLTIRKMRGTKHTLKPQDISINEGGIRLI